MYCNNCGTPNDDNSRFCSSCGSQLAAPSAGFNSFSNNSSFSNNNFSDNSGFDSQRSSYNDKASSMVSSSSASSLSDEVAPSTQGLVIGLALHFVLGMIGWIIAYFLHQDYTKKGELSNAKGIFRGTIIGIAVTAVLTLLGFGVIIAAAVFGGH